MSKSRQTYQGAVYSWHCDHMGHMNVMHYVGKFDEATWNFFSTVGLQGKAMREDKKGVVAVEQSIKYKSELLAGDVITIHSKVVEFGDKSIKFRHEMRNAETGVVAAVTTLTGLYFDKVARKAISLPDQVKTNLQTALDA
ncbi:thioesterase family protein [Paremcibacter congregatus]|uniref:acyl-CoA thioesterase n=1 Tax=Paremcibacter congregatus TaxID=2043170 RepID=UPI0030EE2AB3